MKIMNYQGRKIELCSVRFFFRDEPIEQEGIMVHDSEDVNHDSDAIYGNNWTLDSIQDESDLESLFTSGDGTTYWHKNADGTYTIDA